MAPVSNEVHWQDHGGARSISRGDHNDQIAGSDVRDLRPSRPGTAGHAAGGVRRWGRRRLVADESVAQPADDLLGELAGRLPRRRCCVRGTAQSGRGTCPDSDGGSAARPRPRPSARGDALFGEHPRWTVVDRRMATW